jgi:hypothetical protein
MARNTVFRNDKDDREGLSQADSFSKGRKKKEKATSR